MEDHQRDRDVHVSMVVMAHHFTLQETTIISPNTMMMGREVHVPIDLLFGGPSEPKEALCGSNFCVAHLKKGQKGGRGCMRLRPHNRATGEISLYGSTPSPKLQMFWDGPFLIIHKLSDALYQIQRSACKITYFKILKLAYVKERIPWIPDAEPEFLLEEVIMGGRLT